MGDDDLSNQAYQNLREQLERDIDSLQAGLKQVNEANKPPPPRKPSKWVRFRDGVLKKIKVNYGYNGGEHSFSVGP